MTPTEPFEPVQPEGVGPPDSEDDTPASTEGWDGWTPRPDPGALASATSLEELERKLDAGDLDTGDDE